MYIIQNLANSTELQANYSAIVDDSNANHHSYNSETSEQWIATKIHSHFHNNTISSNNTDCVNIAKMIANYLVIVSKNLTNILLNSSSNNSTQQYLEINNNNDNSITNSESQKSALLYIVVVLSFYAFGIGLMMIKYMRHEAKEQEECKKYRRYINSAREHYLNSTSHARLANRLALQALNNGNTIPQIATHFGSKITFV